MPLSAIELDRAQRNSETARQFVISCRMPENKNSDEIYRALSSPAAYQHYRGIKRFVYFLFG